MINKDLSNSNTYDIIYAEYMSMYKSRKIIIFIVRGLGFRSLLIKTKQKLLQNIKLFSVETISIFKCNLCDNISKLPI